MTLNLALKLASCILLLIAAFATRADTGPSSSQSPYLTPRAPGIQFTSIITTGDEVRVKGNETYRMVGIPDGLGAYDNGDGTITVLMNHEIGTTKVDGVDVPLGVVRAHGARGAFVSLWQIRKSDLRVWWKAASCC